MIKKAAITIVILVVVAAAGFFLFAPRIVERQENVVETDMQSVVDAKARAFHDTLVVADLHADSLLWNRELIHRGTQGQVDIPRLIEGNVALEVFTTVTKTPAGLNYGENSAEARDNITLLAIVQLWPVRTWFNLTERALYQAFKLNGFAHAAPGRLTIIESAEDLRRLMERRARGDKIVGALLGVEGLHALEGDIDNVDRLYDAGFRMMSLQHFFDNALGGSLHGTSKAGLTKFGEAVVRRIEEKSIMLDVSHSSVQVVRDVLAISRRPVIVSHTGTHGHCPSERNLPDDLMRAIAEEGGLIGIGFWEAAVCDYSAAGIAKALIAAVDLLGEDHVGLGSDFDGAITTKIDASQMAQITAELLRQGMPEETIRKVMGQNQVDFFARMLPEQ